MEGIQAIQRRNSRSQVLIYDGHGRDILSPILSVVQLREFGISFHEFISKPREPIPGIFLAFSYPHAPQMPLLYTTFSQRKIT